MLAFVHFLLVCALICVSLLLQSENLKTRVLLTGHNLDTALIISSHAHSLCDYDTHQSATLARISAAEASTFAA